MKNTRKKTGWLALVALALGSAAMTPQVRAQDDSSEAQMLIQTLSEEKTEVQQLAAQQANTPMNVFKITQRDFTSDPIQ